MKKKTIYLVRHAQSIPKVAHGFSGWRLSPIGVKQVEELAALLVPLNIDHIFSSPFVRTVATAAPFAKPRALEIVPVDDLRERLIENDDCHPSEEVWHKSWEDFNYAPPGCESSRAAQLRMYRAVEGIARDASGTAAVFSQGNVIGLFLNSLDSGFGRKAVEAIRNPDVIKINWEDGRFAWDRHFRLAGLEHIATAHNQTPKEHSLK